MPRGGGTYIGPDGVGLIARYLAKHPEGVLPKGYTFIPSTSTYASMEDDPAFWSHSEAARKCSKFVEMTGEPGDVVISHPLMLHSVSKNILRALRVISNPHVSLREPFNFNRTDPKEYSLVELKTLKDLGVERLDFKPTTERRRIVPERIARMEKMLEEEKKRLAASDEQKGANLSLSSLPKKGQPIAVS